MPCFLARFPQRKHTILWPDKEFTFSIIDISIYLFLRSFKI
jgi:hypothetical protein